MSLFPIFKVNKMSDKNIIDAINSKDELTEFFDKINKYVNPVDQVKLPFLKYWQALCHLHLPSHKLLGCHLEWYFRLITIHFFYVAPERFHL